MSERTCSIDGCEGVVHGRGWCQMHYVRWKTHGDTKPRRKYERNPSIEGNIQASGECLIWTGDLTSSGYPTISMSAKKINVRRHLYEKANGPIPHGMKLSQICFNKLCVNVEHLQPKLPRLTVAHRNRANANSSTGVRNVFLNKADGTFFVLIVCAGVRHYFGRFPTLDEASEVASLKRKMLFGEPVGSIGTHGSVGGAP